MKIFNFGDNGAIYINNISFKKGACSRSPDRVNFWALSANSSKMVKAADFKFVLVSTKRH